MRVKTFLIILIASCFVVACSKNETPQSSPAAENVPMTITPIKVGVIFDKTTLPHYMSRSENSIKLATEDLNNAGGLLGRPVKLIIRDSRGQPSDALQVVQELYSSHNIDVLLSHTSTRVSLVLSDFSKRQKLPFFTVWCTDDDCTWKNYHPYIFALDDTPSVSAKAFAQEVAKLEISRWSTVAASVAYGHKFTDAFKFELKALRPDVEFISEQWPAMFKTDMGPVVQAVKSTDPQGVFLILFGQDLFEYIREAKKRGISKSVLHVAPSLGWPEEMEVMGDEVPEGWLVMGYPGDELAMPEHLEFRRRYEARFDQSLGFSGLDGHLLFTLFKNAVEKAGSVDAEAIVKAAEGLTIDTPIGDVSMRAIDHRSTRGYWIGRTVYRNGKPTIENYNRSDVEKLSPSDEWILAQRATK